MNTEQTKKLFEYMKLLGLRKPADIDPIKAIATWTEILRDCDAASVKVAITKWAETSDFWPTAPQLARRAQSSAPQAAPSGDPDVLPNVELLPAWKYQEYLDEFANGPDGETNDEIFERMSSWVAGNVDAW